MKINSIEEAKEYIKNNPGCVLEKHEKLYNEWDYKFNGSLDEYYFTYHNSQKVQWICSKDSHHKWLGKIGDRCIYNCGCPICTNKKICPCKCNTFGFNYPNIAKEWHEDNEYTAYDYSIKSSIRVQWRCTKIPHHTWWARINSRAYGINCPVCVNIQICPCKCNSLAVLRPDIAYEWDYSKNGALNPGIVGIGSNKKVWWKCNKDPHHSWRTAIYHHTTENSGCSICSGYRLCPCRCNSFGKMFPDLLKEWDMSNTKSPNEYLPFSNFVVKWTCANGHTWSDSICSRSKHGTQCPKCVPPYSNGECTISNYLNNWELKFKPQKKFKDCVHKKELIYDFYIPELNILIEFDGEQHFNKNMRYYTDNSQLRDLIKTAYARQNYYFLRISYKEIHIAEKILLSFIIDIEADLLFYGFYYNYKQTLDENSSIMKVYKIHDQCNTNNIIDMHNKLIN